jgi:hypothetical protein
MTESGFLLAILDRLPTQVAVVAATGNIVYVNARWLRFGWENGAADETAIGVGSNYFDVCRTAVNDPLAQLALDGMQLVLREEESYFEMEYPCDSKHESRWFAMQVAPFAYQNQPHLLVTHVNITGRLPDAIRSKSHEMDSLAKILQMNPAVATGQSFGVKSLREGMPNTFAELLRQYQAIWDDAVQRRSHKVESDASERLRAVAQILGSIKAHPRDVVEIHTRALRYKSEESNPLKLHAYVEEGRLLLLELMGYLASYYRNFYRGPAQTDDLITANAAREEE